jgi:hypothetical protein
MLPLLLALSITSSEIVKDESYVPQVNDECCLYYEGDLVLWIAKDKTSYLTYHWLLTRGDPIGANKYKEESPNIIEATAGTKVIYLGETKLYDPSINAKTTTRASLIKFPRSDKLYYTYPFFISRFREVPIATWRHPVLLQSRIKTLLRSANNLERMHKTKGAAEHYREVLKLSADDSTEHKIASSRLRALEKAR